MDYVENFSYNPLSIHIAHFEHPLNHSQGLAPSKQMYSNTFVPLQKVNSKLFMKEGMTEVLVEHASCFLPGQIFYFFCFQLLDQ